jgi:hypothetical protein
MTQNQWFSRTATSAFHTETVGFSHGDSRLWNRPGPSVTSELKTRELKTRLHGRRGNGSAAGCLGFTDDVGLSHRSKASYRIMRTLQILQTPIANSAWMEEGGLVLMSTKSM